MANYRELLNVAKASEVVKMIGSLELDGEFTKKDYDCARVPGSTTIDWCREHGIGSRGFGSKPWSDRENFRPIIKLVRKEYFTVTLKAPIRKLIVVTAEGKEIPNIDAYELRWNKTVQDLLRQLYPNYRTEEVTTDTIDVCRHYYEIDREVLTEMAQWCDEKGYIAKNYYGDKLAKAKAEVARLERICSAL